MSLFKLTDSPFPFSFESRPMSTIFPLKINEILDLIYLWYVLKGQDTHSIDKGYEYFSYFQSMFQIEYFLNILNLSVI